MRRGHGKLLGEIGRQIKGQGRIRVRKINMFFFFQNTLSDLKVFLIGAHSKIMKKSKSGQIRRSRGLAAILVLVHFWQFPTPPTFENLLL